MYTSTTSVGSLSGNAQIPHNCNTGQMRDLVLLREIVLAIDTMAKPPVVVGDLTVAKDSALLEHIGLVPEASPFDCIAAEATTQTVVAAVMV